MTGTLNSMMDRPVIVYMKDQPEGAPNTVLGMVRFVDHTDGFMCIRAKPDRDDARLAHALNVETHLDIYIRYKYITMIVPISMEAYETALHTMRDQ